MNPPALRGLENDRDPLRARGHERVTETVWTYEGLIHDWDVMNKPCICFV